MGIKSGVSLKILLFAFLSFFRPGHFAANSRISKRASRRLGEFRILL